MVMNGGTQKMYCNESLPIWNQEIQSDEMAVVYGYEDRVDWEKEIEEYPF